jgi:hypothetical protein
MGTLSLLLSAVLVLLFDMCTAEKYGVDVNIGNKLQCWDYISHRGEIGGDGKKEKCLADCCIKVSRGCIRFSVRNLSSYLSCKKYFFLILFLRI